MDGGGSVYRSEKFKPENIKIFLTQAELLLIDESRARQCPTLSKEEKKRNCLSIYSLTDIRNKRLTIS
jgi:hypothetical protein